MSTSADAQQTHGLTFRKGRWIDGWDPENETQWKGIGHRIANRNLGFSIYAEFLGFVVWQLWSIVVVSLKSWQGFSFDSNQQFWLISLPSLVGATLRFPYTFMVAKMGGRNWTILSATFLLIPTTAMAFAIANHPDASGAGGTSYGMMLFVAALGGFGGGNFASSMANITYYFPQRARGLALGMNAAGGNVGAAVAQFSVPILVGLIGVSVVGTDINLPVAGWFWIPFIVLAIIFAIFGMNNLSSAKTDFGGYVAALKDWNLWVLSFLYIGTFGSFIGLAGAFPKLIVDQFQAFSTINLHFGVSGIIPIGLAFVGPLVGSIARPFGGRVADNVGGAYVTVAAFGLMILATLASIVTLAEGWGFWVFLLFFMVLFIATGIGNGSMYKMIPTIFALRAGVKDAQHVSGDISSQRKTSAALGIVAAFGAYGGFIVPQVFNKALSITSTHPKDMQVVDGYSLGLWWLFGSYIVFLLVLIAVYVIPYIRRGARV